MNIPLRLKDGYSFVIGDESDIVDLVDTKGKRIESLYVVDQCFEPILAEPKKKVTMDQCRQIMNEIDLQEYENAAIFLHDAINGE